MALMDDTDKAINNSGRRKELIRSMNTIESQVLAWMASATMLHTDVDQGDKDNVLALRDELIQKLTSATAI